ncbi:MAG: hypothetical protein JRF24_09210 [Deltaproteobacteria bacterium]|nr:hypothetical protein [Deltaproteobacteria bacterium]
MDGYQADGCISHGDGIYKQIIVSMLPESRNKSQSANIIDYSKDLDSAPIICDCHIFTGRQILQDTNLLQ